MVQLKKWLSNNFFFYLKWIKKADKIIENYPLYHNLSLSLSSFSPYPLSPLSPPLSLYSDTFTVFIALACKKIIYIKTCIYFECRFTERNEVHISSCMLFLSMRPQLKLSCVIPHYSSSTMTDALHTLFQMSTIT